MNAKISVFVIYVESIIYLSLYNLHNCTFNKLNQKSNSCPRLDDVTFRMTPNILEITLKMALTQVVQTRNLGGLTLCFQAFRFLMRFSFCRFRQKLTYFSKHGL